MLMKLLPEEKLRSAGEDHAAEGTSPVIPDLVREIAEIDINEGLRHNGSADIYMETLTIYAGTVGDNCDEIEKYRNVGDIADMTVKIHAIKSTSRLIGAVKLGSLAEDLEAAGRANDTLILDAHLDELLSRCRALGQQLAPLLQSDGLPLIMDDELQEAYSLIRDYLAASDYESALQIAEYLGGYSYPEKEKQRCESLKRAALEFDYDAMSKAVSMQSPD